MDAGEMKRKENDGDLENGEPFTEQRETAPHRQYN